MQADTVATLAKIDTIVGIKEACGDPERVGQIRSLVSPDFTVLSGEDAQTQRMMELGANGTISVSANVIPELMAGFIDTALSGDLAGAAKLDAKLQEIHAAMFVESSPTPVKWALHEMGRVSAGIRLPLLPLTDANRATVRTALTTAGAL